MPDTFMRGHGLFLWSLAAVIFGLFLWIIFAKLDIVLVSQGKLVPAGFVQVIQAPEETRVARVLVRDGEHVAKGQPLVELDPGYVQEDVTAAKVEVQALQDRLTRSSAESTGMPLSVANPKVQAEYLQRRAMQAALVAEAQRTLEQARAELMTVRERRTKYETLLPVAQRQADMLGKLRSEGFVSEAAHNEKVLAALDTSREASVQARAEETAAAQVRAAEAALTKVKADYARQLAVEQTEVHQNLQQAQANLAKQEHRAGLQVLRAPADGHVTGVKLHSQGQVVALGEALLSLVPDGQPLRYEGWLRNEDSAFVTPGLPVKVKMTAYEFQKYGWLEGPLSWVGVDSETPESMRNAQGEPLFYRVRVTLPAQTLELDGKPLPLKAGMQATGDLQVGRRTIFEYLTSPMRKVLLEAARER